MTSHRLSLFSRLSMSRPTLISPPGRRLGFDRGQVLLAGALALCVSGAAFAQVPVSDSEVLRLSPLYSLWQSLETSTLAENGEKADALEPTLARQLLLGEDRGGVGPGIGFFPRVAGLSIHVTNEEVVPTGRQVDFDVLLTTIRTGVGSRHQQGPVSSVAEGTSGYAALAFTGTASFRGTDSVSPPRLGRMQLEANANLTISRNGTATVVLQSGPPIRGVGDGTTAPFTGDRNIAGVTTGASFYLQASSSGVPGIDFGDGQTVPTAVMTSVVSQQTTTDIGSVGGFLPIAERRTTRYRRSGFSHVFPASGQFEMVVRSGCCSGSGGGAVYGSESVRLATTGHNYHQGQVTQAELGGTFQFNDQSVQAFNTTVSNPSTMIYNEMGSVSGSTTVTGVMLPRLESRYVVGSVLAVPTLTHWSLGCLALVLMFLGLRLLRV